MPNNREWALLFWLIVATVWVVSRRDMRPSLNSVVRALLHPKLLGALGGMVGWVALELVVGARLGIWDSTLITSTVVWFVTSAVVLFGKLTDVSKHSHFFRRTAGETVGLTAVIQGLTELAVLPLLAEVLLQPVAALLIGVSIVAAREPHQAPAKKLADGLLGVIGLGIVLYTAVKLASSLADLDKSELSLQLALPFWLTAGLLPFIYVAGLAATYESAFLRMAWRQQAGWRTRARSKLLAYASFHLRARELGTFNGMWPRRLFEADSFRDGRRVIAAFRESKAEELRVNAEAEERLRRFAGVDGHDETGRRLDQREFEETKRALRWLATCQMGWHNRDGRYRLDLLDVLDDDFSLQGLPKPAGVEMSVADDGQRWFAHRRTVSGWCFAIGSSEPPPNQWEYDGAQPPTGYPGDDPVWGDSTFDRAANPNW